jgi:hypothetical protein
MIEIGWVGGAVAMIVPWSLVLDPFGGLLKAAAEAGVEHLRAKNRAAETINAERAHEWAKDEASHRAALLEQKAQDDFARAWNAEEHTASVRLWLQGAVQDAQLRQEASPFRLPDDDIRMLSAAVTDDGEIPALIIAPFVDRASGTAGPEVSRQLWWRAQQRAEWTSSLAGLSGHMRPVEHLDLDIDLIRLRLGRVPFVLIHGDAEVDRVQVRIVGSGMMPVPGTSPQSPANSDYGPSVSITGPLPWSPGPPAGRLADFVMDALIAYASALGEIYHLSRSGLQPRLHELVPDWLRPTVTSIIIGGYGIALRDRPWNKKVVIGLQDLVRSMPAGIDPGLHEQAESLLDEVWQKFVDDTLVRG